MMPIQMRIWSEAITASEFCLLFDSHKMAIFNIRLLHIRLCLRPTSAIPCIKFSGLQPSDRLRRHLLINVELHLPVKCRQAKTVRNRKWLCSRAFPII